MWIRERLEKRLREYGEEGPEMGRGFLPGSWFPGPNISDRAFWESLPASVKEGLLLKGKEELPKEWPALRMSLYREFSKNGNRLLYENPMFLRRTRLNHLILAECAENKGRFLKDIIDGLFLILEESSWCLPAHNSYIRDSLQLPYPRLDHPVIDLFQAETAACLALAEYLLRPVLDRESSIIGEDLDFVLRKRLLEPYLREHFWWMGRDGEPMNNWTAWCSQNVLLTVFSRRPGFLSGQEARQILLKAGGSLDYFLKEYAEDGVCDEGAQYYTHAALCLYLCLEILDQLSDGALAEIWRSAKLRNMADYIRKMYVGDGYYLNFSDCSARPGRRSARDYLFAKKTGNLRLQLFAALDFREDPEALLPKEHNLYYRLLQLLYWREMRDYENPEKEKGSEASCAKSCIKNEARSGEKKDFAERISKRRSISEEEYYDWMPESGLLVVRTAEWVLGAKAGDNADSHNHNDAGSFTLYKDKRPYLIDLGVESYTRKTFSEERYSIWTMRSQYHNLPSFYEGDRQIEQAPGAEYAVREAELRIFQRGLRLSMELAGAYPAKGIRSYLRSITVDFEEGISLIDRYEGEYAAVLNLMCYEKPELFQNCAAAAPNRAEAVKSAPGKTKSCQAAKDTIRFRLGDLGELEIRGAVDWFRDSLPVTDQRLQTVWKHELYRLRLCFEKEIRVKFL